MMLRWYYFLSVWTFLLGATYILHHQNVYPLHLFCLLGLVAVPFMQQPQQLLKQLLLIVFHLLPFLWLPAILNQQGLFFALSVIIIYMIIMTLLHKNIIQLYMETLTKHHPSTYAFLQELIGV